MPNEEPMEAFELPTDPSVVRRDRLLAALFEVDPEMCLLDHGPAFSHAVTTREPPQIFLLPTRDRDAAGRLSKMIDAIEESAARGPFPTHFVAVGGGPDVAAALARAANARPRAPLGFHHVDDASTYAHVKGQKLVVLERAAAAMRATEPPTPERIRTALAKGHALALRDKRAVARLRGERRPFVTTAIIASCVGIFVLSSLVGRRAGGLDAVVLSGAVNGPLVRSGELYRIFSSVFLHGGVMHVGMNMLALSSLGGMLEPVLGPRRFVTLYGLSGLAGAMATMWGGGERFSVGASGAIWGLMMALVGLLVFPRGVLPPLLITRLKTNAWRPVVLNVFLSFVPGIDWRAHFGGGAVGFVLGAFVLGRGLVPMEERAEGQSAERGRPWRSLSTAAAIVVCAAMFGSLAWGAAATRPWAMGDPPKMTRTSIGGAGLSLEIPAELAKKPKVEPLAGGPAPAVKYVYGDLDRAPVEIDVIVEPLGESRADDDVEGQLDEERARLDAEAPYTNATRVGHARIVTAGGRKAVVVDHAVEDLIVLRTYVVVVAGDVVTVRSHARKDRPAGWKGIEEVVVGSIRGR